MSQTAIGRSYYNNGKKKLIKYIGPWIGINAVKLDKLIMIYNSSSSWVGCNTHIIIYGCA
jgi:hypothetical protein